MGAGGHAVVGIGVGWLVRGDESIRPITGSKRIETEKRGFGVGLLPHEMLFRRDRKLVKKSADQACFIHGKVFSFAPSSIK